MSCTPECHKPHGRQAHCGACHRTFSVVSNFDLHRRGGTCDAEGRGLTEKNGVWAAWGSAFDNKWWNDEQ